MSNEGLDTFDDGNDINVDDLFGEPSTGGTPKNESKKEKAEETVPLARYKDAEKKISEMGESIAENTKWFSQAKPWLDKLVESPEIVDAILSGKLDSNLSKAIVEGKISTETAKEVTQAKEEVKEELGKDFIKLTPQQLEKLVDEKLNERLDTFKEKIDTEFSKHKVSDEAEKENSAFVSRTPDIAEYADEINEWLSEPSHQNIWRLEDAYYAIKGRRFMTRAAEKKAKEETEAKKQIALNANGASSQAGTLEKDNLVDSIFSGHVNANKPR
jgi:hypothetical protein